MSDRHNHVVIHNQKNKNNNNGQNKNGFFIQIFPLTTRVEKGESSSSSNNNKQTEEEEKKKITEEKKPEEEKKKKTEEEEEEKKKKTEDALRKNKGIVFHEGEGSEASSSSTHKKTEEEEKKTKYNFNLVITYGSSDEESVLNPTKSELSTVYMGFQKKNLRCVASCSKNKRSEEEEEEVDAFEQFFNPTMIEKLSTYVIICGCVFVIAVAAGVIKETIASNNNM